MVLDLNINLRQIKYLLDIRNEKNISQAARINMISQPYLSKLISKIENQLGVQLFLYENNKLTETEEGKAILDEFQKIKFSSDEIEKIVTYYRMKNSEEHVTFGMPRATSSWYMNQIFSQFYQNNFKADLAISVMSTGDLIKNVSNGTIQIATTGSYDFPEEIEAQPLRIEPLLIITNAEHNLGYKDALNNSMYPVNLPPEKFPELTKLPFFIPPQDHGVGKRAEEIIRKYKLPFKEIANIQGSDAAFTIVSNSSGASIVIQTLAIALQNTIKSNLCYFTIGSPPESWTRYLIKKKGTELPPAAKELYRLCMKYFSQVPEYY